MDVLNSRISGSYAADPDLQIGGGGGGAGGWGGEGEGALKTYFFSVLRASVWSKNKGKRGPRKDGHFLLTRK